MAKEDIAGSIAHATMLGECGIISAQGSGVDLPGFERDFGGSGIRCSGRSIPMPRISIPLWRVTLTARIGQAGKRLHTARSRNDQVALDLRMSLKTQAKGLRKQLVSLVGTLCDQAEKYADTVMPGLHASPTCAADHIRPSSDGLCRNVPKGSRAAFRMQSGAWM